MEINAKDLKLKICRGCGHISNRAFWECDKFLDMNTNVELGDDGEWEVDFQELSEKHDEDYNMIKSTGRAICMNCQEDMWDMDDHDLVLNGLYYRN